MQLLDQIIKFIMENLLPASATIGLVIEFILRMVKTEKPRSILYMIRGALDIAVGFLSKLIEVVKALIAFLDRILPQRLK